MATKKEETTKKEVVITEQQAIVMNPTLQAIKMNELCNKMAELYTTSTIVPVTFRNNIGNCTIAIDMAMRMGVNPLMVMQNLYVVNGQPSWSSKFLIASINRCGRFTPLRYQYYGQRGNDNYACRCYAYEKDDKKHEEPLTGVWVSMKMAKDEGWLTKPGSKWLTMPDLMMQYRAASFWARAFAPEISMGFPTQDEVEDAVVIDDVATPSPVINDADAPTIDNLPEDIQEESKEESSETQDDTKPVRTAQQIHEEWKSKNAKDIVAESLKGQNGASAEEIYEQAMGGE